MAEIHRDKSGCYHPNPAHDVAWTINDTRGYLDGGPACDECGACECETCPHGDPFCEAHAENVGNGADCERECIGLAFAYVCLDGGEALCEKCAEKAGISIGECDCR